MRITETIGCVIMASGMSVRFGSNKLMEDFHGQPMLSRILYATERLPLSRVVVTRHADVADYCKSQGIQVILHEFPDRNDTIRLGLEALGMVDGCMFCLADQPLLKRDTVERLIHGWELEKTCIWRVSYGGAVGSPVLFPSWLFPELMTLPKGKGGSHLLSKYTEQIRQVEVSDPYELMDADTRESFQMLLEYDRMKTWSDDR